jgi:hypothetical protein
MCTHKATFYKCGHLRSIEKLKQCDHEFSRQALTYYRLQEFPRYQELAKLCSTKRSASRRPSRYKNSWRCTASTACDLPISHKMCSYKFVLFKCGHFHSAYQLAWCDYNSANVRLWYQWREQVGCTGLECNHTHGYQYDPLLLRRYEVNMQGCLRVNFREVQLLEAYCLHCLGAGVRT